MSNVIAFQNPVIKDFQDAVVANCGFPAPRVVRRSDKHWVVYGVNGESSPYTLDQIKLFTRALWANMEQRA